ncbi:hypothetical protein HPP92_018682 [Vanilla planifolia]|uniref:Nodulation signaling pathway 2-like protein n=1 Tax=Vanilla planifolia TaxID=51239 RepID=A0A835QBJ3_VANPL|nr:hypothetical protein HPP92_018682 [Vanilla planifolia]
MELVMERMPELKIPASSSTTTTPTTVEHEIRQYDWSPDIGWGHVLGNADDHLRCLAACTAASIGVANIAAAVNVQDWASLARSPASTMSGGTLVEEPICAIAAAGDDSKGLRLFHLLMAAADALSMDQKNRELARVILVRLRELASPTGALGIERLASHFTDAIQSLLDSSTCPRRGDIDQIPHQHRHPTDVSLTAFQLLQHMSPCVSFCYLTANQAILEAISGERRVHIVDYNISEGVQWASLIQAISSGFTGFAHPPPLLKITAVTNGSRRSSAVAHEAGRRLSAFAASIGQPFSFRLCRLDCGRKFQPTSVKVVKGEAVVFNCVLHQAHLQHGSAVSVMSFLEGAAAIEARVVTVVEEEGGDGSSAAGEKEVGFAGRFMDEVKRYIAVWDYLEAGFPMQGMVRQMVERVILGPGIAGAVRRAYERHVCGDRARDGCAEWLATSGFDRVALSFFNLSQARLLLGLFQSGFHIDEDAPNKLTLRWKSRRLLSASVWVFPPPKSSSPSSAF